MAMRFMGQRSWCALSRGAKIINARVVKHSSYAAFSVWSSPARAFTPLSSSVFTDPHHHQESESSALEVQATMRNPVAKYGRLQVALPLPGQPGLSTIQENNDAASVQDVIDLIKQRDPSLKSVEITTTNGTKLARTVHLKELVCMNFIVRLNHVNVLIEHDADVHGQSFRGETAGFASVKAALEKDPRTVLPLDEFYRLCINAGAEETVAQKWLRELQRRNLVVHFEHSNNDELRHTILLRPNCMESQLLLQNALDSTLYNIKHEKKKQESKQHELASTLRKMENAVGEIERQAHRKPNAYKWLAWTSMTSLYGSLMYLVWDVYSWDIMEPITYFIGFTAVLGNSFYHAVTKRDATYTNVWHRAYQERIDALLKERKISRKNVEKLKRQLNHIDRDIDALTTFEDKPQSLH